MNAIEQTDADRFPLLTDAGRRMLEFLREHPNAPIYRDKSGHRLDAADLAFVRAEESRVLAASFDWHAASHAKPAWLPAFIADCVRDVPRYRRADFAKAAELARAAIAGDDGAFPWIPTTTRADLGHDIAAYVPDSVAVERLVNFQTSGTTGHPLHVPSQPRVAASYLAYHKRALRRFGVTLNARAGTVGVVLLGFQQICFTYVSVTPAMDEAGLAKINLHPNDWRALSDRAAYLEALAPEVIAGDPLSYAELLRIAPNLRPKALLSTSMTLLPGLRAELEDTFNCPVLDLYSLNEAGPVAVFDPACDGHVILQPRLYVEILDIAGNPVPAGQRGEVTLTGGFNFCLPLLRYRTGDFASLAWVNGEPVLRQLEGRPVVRFRRADGTWLNNVDITHTLRPLPLARFALHQRDDGALDFSVEGSPVAMDEARAALAKLFGAGVIIAPKPFANAFGKVVQYTSAIAS